MSSDIIKNLSSFRCTQCGACCRISGYVFLKDEELDKIASFFNLSVAEFTAKFCEISSDRHGLVLKCKTDESCIMLDASNRCIIHEVKPEQCSGFPHSWRNPDSDAVCPAMRRCSQTRVNNQPQSQNNAV